jgi:hypothetical protein
VVEPADILSEMGEAYGYRIGRGLASGGWILHDLGFLGLFGTQE